jgi:HEAT repeat protein
MRQLPAFELSPAVREGLTQCEARVEASRPAIGTTSVEVEPEQVRGLVLMLAGARDQLRNLPLEEIRSLGDGAAPTLAAIAANVEQPSEERIAACELLAKLGSPRATEHLLQLCENAPQPWLRAQAAWRLEEVNQDWVVPRLILRLKQEHDEQTVIWLASTLWSYANGAGLEPLWKIRNSSGNERLRQTASERLDALATSSGLDSPLEHWELWNGTGFDGRLRQSKASARLELAAWQLIDQLAGEQDLQLDNDSFFVLARMGSWSVEILSQALHDEDVSVRINAARCLEAMGPRGNLAGPTLLQGLADPGLASAATAALGQVAYPPAEPILRSLLTSSETPHQLRMSCARALAGIGLSSSIEPLESVMNSSEREELRLLCAVSLVRLGVGDRAASFLFETLSHLDGDRLTAESALGQWLAGAEGQTAQLVAEQWQAMDPDPGDVLSDAEISNRMKARLHLLQSHRAELTALN